MATPEQQPGMGRSARSTANSELGQDPGGNQTFLAQKVAPIAESLSKSVAAAAIAMYAFGFVIVSLHYSRYGFITTNPFRPRILAAGAWFFFLSAVPIISARGLIQRSPKMPWQDILDYSFLYYMACIGLGFFAAPVFCGLP